jgi:hypothetical protein
MTNTGPAAPAAAHPTWAETHCYLCGDDLPERTQELLHASDERELTADEEEFLTTPESGCRNACWEKEEAADAAWHDR